MSRKGDCWDNAPMESFFHTLKTERDHHRVYATRDQARRDLFQYIEGFYNPPATKSTFVLSAVLLCGSALLAFVEWRPERGPPVRESRTRN
jgi:Integrase core domain